MGVPLTPMSDLPGRWGRLAVGTLRSLYWRALRSFILLGEMRKSFRGGDSEWKRKRKEQVWSLKGPPEGGGQQPHCGGG